MLLSEVNDIKEGLQVLECGMGRENELQDGKPYMIWKYQGKARRGKCSRDEEHVRSAPDPRRLCS